MTNQEIKAKAAKIIEAAAAKGVVALYPTMTLDPEDMNKDIANCIRDMWGDNGTFRTVKTIGSDDVIALSGLADEENDTQTVKIVGGDEVYAIEWDDYLNEDGPTIFQAPPDWTGDTDSVFCFWNEENPYPGTPDTE